VDTQRPVDWTSEVIEMRQKRASYSLEFKLQAIQLVKEGGQSMADVARSLGVPKSTLFDWVREHDKERDEENGRKSRTNGEVLRLKRELEQAKKERDFLKKACAFFAQDDNKRSR